jgi:phosphotransacetylase
VDDDKEVRNIVATASKKFDGRIKGGLSKITITIPSILNEINNNTYYNFISSVSDMIYNSRIHVQDAFFTPNEIVLILDDKDAARAYELLRAKITK